MSAAVHLVCGRIARGRPTLLAAVRHAADRRDERIVSLGTGLRGAAATIPMPAGRFGIAAKVLSRWADGQMERGDVLIAWDTTSLSAAAETGHSFGVVLDGGPNSGAIARCDALCVGPGGVPLPPAAPAAAARAEPTPLRITIAVEPDGVCCMRPLACVLARLHLLGLSMQVRIAGVPADVTASCGMLADIGIDDVVLSTLGSTRYCPGEVAYFPVPPPALSGVPPVAPAVMAWANGADILLPAAHPAVNTLGGKAGVMVMKDTAADAAIWWITGARSSDVASRIEVVDAWRAKWDRSLDEFIATQGDS